MSSPSTARVDVTDAPGSELGLAAKVTVLLLAILGISALGGGAVLVAAPDGSIMHLPVSILDGSPFPDFLVPGLILGGLFGLGSFAVALMGLRRWPIAPFLAFAIGCGQMIWIVVELAIIKGVSVLHPTYFGIGLVIALVSLRWGWPTFRAWRAR